MSIPVSTLTGSNTINQMMYNVNTIKNLAANSASAITGPGSSTDNAVVRWDGTNGLSTQNSGVTIADDSSMIISGSSSGDMLRITQTGAGNALVVEDSTNPDSTPFVVDASGNVGIGTNSPTGNLHIVRTAASAGWTVRAKTAGVANDSGLYVDASNNIELAVRDGSGTFTGAVRSSGVTFFNGGNVGIGTASPLARFNVNSGGAIVTSDGDYFAGGAYYDGGWKNSVASQGGWVLRNTAGVLAIQTAPPNGAAGSALSMAERMRIDGNGNVGIGRTPTTNLLEVAGTIESTSGGFKFPDGSTQTSAASAGITTGKAIAMAIVFG